MGDKDLKQFGVISKPDVTVHHFKRSTMDATQGVSRLHPDWVFLVVATDGVWDVIQPEQCASVLQATLNESEIPNDVHERPTKVGFEIAEVGAQKLVDVAKSVRENNDDVTAIVVSLLVN